jgi:hypothetical protein
MVAAPEGGEASPATHAVVQPVLDCHLHGDFDGDRPGLGEKYVVEVARQQVRQPLRQRVGRLVGEPAEHDVRQDVELAAHGVADVGMVVAVAGRPPRGDAVDQLAPVGEHDPRAMGAHHRHGRWRSFHLGVRQPDMGPPGCVPRRRFAHAPTVVMPSLSRRTRSRSASGFGVVRSLGP